VFKNLESDRDYTFYVRVAATTGVFASDIASITVHLSSSTEVVYGDCNYDGKVNLLDLIAMRKYLAKWSISIDQTAADCNCDGKLNLLDLIVMRKYLARWNIVLGPQK
ncbi:MAG: dockerin type I repeat-containing protein, partial [Acutalibacteraceae bacterium]